MVVGARRTQREDGGQGGEPERPEARGQRPDSRGRKGRGAGEEADGGAGGCFGRWREKIGQGLRGWIVNRSGSTCAVLADTPTIMRIFALVFVVLLGGLGPVARANFYVPRARLIGETVHVRLLKDVAEVTAVFEFEGWETSDDKILYLPLFAGPTVSPTRLLGDAGLQLTFNGQNAGQAAPCPAPERLRAAAPGRRVLWFAVHVDDLLPDSAAEVPPVVIKASYLQPLIGGHFFYLPVIAGQSKTGDRRAWSYQLHVHSPTHVTQLVSQGVDHEPLSDGLVIYLRDGEVVDVR